MSILTPVDETRIEWVKGNLAKLRKCPYDRNGNWLAACPIMLKLVPVQNAIGHYQMM